MKRILIVLVIGFVFATASAQMDNPLKQGMLNTVTLSNGEVIYDLRGEWDAIYDNKGYGGINKDIVKITQKGNEFVGIKLIGDQWIGKNQEVVKGELEKNRFRKVYATAYDLLQVRGIWVRSKGEITEDGNKIVIRSRPYAMYGSSLMIILKRK